MLRWGGVGGRCGACLALVAGRLGQRPLGRGPGRYSGRRGHFRPGGDGPAHDTTVSSLRQSAERAASKARLQRIYAQKGR